MPILDGGDPWGIPTGMTGVLDGGSPSGLPPGSRDTADGGNPDGLPYLNDTQLVLYLASREIQDVTNRRWDKIDVLLSYLNMGIMELVNLKPDALVVTEDLTLEAGAVQAFPVEMIQLIDFVCNVSSAGVLGSEVSGIKKDFIDRMLPGWMNSTAAESVIFAVVDPKDPHTFYVYPRQPSPTTNLLRAKITKQPDEIETIYHELRDLPLDASYQPFLINYIAYRVLSEETTIPNAQAKSNDFYNKALQSIGLKTNTEQQVRGEGL